MKFSEKNLFFFQLLKTFHNYLEVDIFLISPINWFASGLVHVACIKQE